MKPGKTELIPSALKIDYSCTRMRCADCQEQMVINEAYQLAICPRCDRMVCLKHGKPLEPWNAGAKECATCWGERLAQEQRIRSESAAVGAEKDIYEGLRADA